MDGHQDEHREKTTKDQNNEKGTCKQLLQNIGTELKDLKKLLENSKEKITETIGYESEIKFLSEDITRELNECSQFLKTYRSGYLMGKSEEELNEFWINFEVSIKVSQTSTQKLELPHNSLFAKLKEIQSWFQNIQTEIQIISEDIEDFQNDFS